MLACLRCAKRRGRIYLWIRSLKAFPLRSMKLTDILDLEIDRSTIESLSYTTTKPKVRIIPKRDIARTT